MNARAPLARMLVIPAETHPCDHSFLEEVHTRHAWPIERVFLFRTDRPEGAAPATWNAARVRTMPFRARQPLVAWWASYFMDLRWLPMIWRAARTERPAAVYVRDLTFPLAIALALRPFRRWKVIYQRSFPHDLRWLDPEVVRVFRFPWLYAFARRLEAPLLRFLLGRADAVVPISERMAAEMREAGTCRAERLHAFGMGVTRRVVELPDPPARGPGDPLRLIYVGTLAVRRRMERLLEAIGLAATAHGVDAHLLVLGGTADEQRTLREHAERLGVLDRVEIGGRIPRDEVYAAMARCHAGAIYIGRDPRFRVASTTKLVESLALGLPCVATDAVAMHGELESGGEALFVTDDTPAGFAAGIARLDAAWPQMAALARQRRAAIYARYAYENAARGMDELVLSLLGVDPSGPGVAPDGARPL